MTSFVSSSSGGGRGKRVEGHFGQKIEFETSTSTASMMGMRQKGARQSTLPWVWACLRGGHEAAPARQNPSDGRQELGQHAVELGGHLERRQVARAREADQP